MMQVSRPFSWKTLHDKNLNNVGIFQNFEATNAKFYVSLSSAKQQKVWASFLSRASAHGADWQMGNVPADAGKDDLL